jgi:ubiquinone/menaquinone biosynthesis C-methylase UbiE
MLENLQRRCVFVPGDSFPKQVASKVMDVAGIVLNGGELLPPFSMRRIIGESRWQLRGQDFKAQGNHFVQKLTQDAGLRPDSQVLDLGSGCGRIALPLTKILNSTGAYWGLEPMESLVKWCRKRITPSFSNFQFQHCDIYNKLYNKIGKIRPEDFKLPFNSNQFDLIVATSVFTHLTTEAVKNYAAECSRVLKQGGRLFASFFLLESGTCSHDGGINFSCILEPGVSRVIDPTVPEKAIAYSSDWLLSILSSQNMQLIPPIRWGCWTGRQPAYSGQDVLILEKNLTSRH